MSKDTPLNPLEDLLARLRDALGDLTPEPLSERLAPVMEDFQSRFQLVGKREFQSHLDHLKRLEQLVNDLEARIRELERSGTIDHS